MQPVLDLGDVQVFNAEGGRFLLDAGAMTGMVPRALWSREIETDDLGRMQLASNVPVIKIRDRVVLVDLGPGMKLDGKMKDIYHLEEVDLAENVAACGVSPDEVTDIIPTHLHFDHCGGLTRWLSKGTAVPAFPNAVVHIQALEWQAALSPSLITRRTYLPENYVPIADAGLLHLIDGHAEIAAGVEVHRTGGHSSGHQIVRIQGGGTSMYHMGDLLADVHHLHVTWLMAYDRDTFVSLEAKQEFMERAWRENAVVWLGHDASVRAVRIRPDEKRPFYHYEPAAYA